MAEEEQEDEDEDRPKKRKTNGKAKVGLLSNDSLYGSRVYSR